MKIGTYVADAKGNIDPQKVFRPLQTILIAVHAHGGNPLSPDVFLALSAKLNVNIVNSQSGSQDSIIPFIHLNTLGEISTMHEGTISMNESIMVIPVLLNPTSNLAIDNNKYLDIEMSGLLPGQPVDIYGFESKTMSEMVCKYSKFSIPIGTSRQTITVGTNDVLAMPIVKFDSVRITFASGVVADLSPTELDYLMAKENDLTLVCDMYGSQVFIPSRANHYILDLNGVKSFEIIRDSDSTLPYEVIMGDLS